MKTQTAGVVSVHGYSVPPEIHEFLFNLMLEAGMGAVPEQIRERMLTDLAKRLDVKLMLSAVAALGENKKEQFGKILDKSASPTEVMDFLEANVTDFEDVQINAMEDFRRVFLLK